MSSSPGHLANPLQKGPIPVYVEQKGNARPTAHGVFDPNTGLVYCNGKVGLPIDLSSK